VRTVAAGTLAFAGHSGANAIAFQGRISPAKELRPGSYTLILQATNAAGESSAPRRLRFTIVGRPARHRKSTGTGRASAVAAGARHYVEVVPWVVRPGRRVRIYGSAGGGCPAGARVILYSMAFKGAAHDTFAGLPALLATTRRNHAFSIGVRLRRSIRPGRYEVGGRCGGGNFGSAPLRVRESARAAGVHGGLTYVTGSAEHGHLTVWLAGANGSDAHRLGRGEHALISPDGRLVAVARLTQPGTELVIYSEGGDRVASFPTGGLPLAWSSDSRYLATVEEGAQLMVIDTATETLKTIARGFVSGASFAPVGEKLVYGLGMLPPKRMSKVNLFSVGAGGGKARQLTHDGRSLNPLWGRRGIVFDREHTRNGGPAYQIFLLRGRKATQITHVPVSRLSVGLVPKAISGDGRRLLAEYEGEDDTWAWSVDLVTRKVRELKAHGRVVTGWGISRDGRRVLVDSGSRRELSGGEVETMPFSGGRAQVLVRNGGAPSWNR
jgi:hypothetical protein